MESMEAELQEMLEIGMYLGPGPRYLLYYYSQLAITNDTGLMHWPEGPKVIIAVIKAQECASGFSPTRKTDLLARLSSLQNIKEIQRCLANEERRKLALQRN